MLSSNFTHVRRFHQGRPDLKDTIKRLQAYQEAGADVLYAPGLKSKEEIAAVVSSAVSTSRISEMLQAAGKL